MSVQAMKWAYSVADLKPGVKFVLVTLANYADEFGVCWPRQDTLAADTGQGERTVREAMTVLEQLELIHRVTRRRADGTRRSDVVVLTGFKGRKKVARPDDHPALNLLDVDDRSKSPTTNRQNLPVEDRDLFTPDNRQDLPPDNRQISPDQPAEYDRINRQDSPVYIEPPLEPSKEPPEEDEERASARGDLSDFVRQIVEALGYPEVLESEFWRHEAETGHRVAAWRTAGLDDAEILDVARRHGQEMPEPPRGPKALDRAMERAAQRNRREQDGSTRSRKSRHDRPTASLSDRVAFFSDWVHSDRHMPPSALTSSMRNELLRRNLVTEEQLRRKGLG